MARPIKGNNEANTLNGTSGRDRIEGRGGDDFIYGFGGDDHLDGGDGDDTIYGDAGKDNINGDDGDDTLHGGADNDKIDGDDGDDAIYGDAGNDEIDGDDGNDTITGGSGSDEIDGGKGVDTAIFSGSYSEYAITAKNGPGHGNKLIVADTFAFRDGTDEVKNVEFLKFLDATYNVETGEAAVWHYVADGTLDPSARDPNQSTTPTPKMYAGNGIPADHFGIARNEDAGVELALKVHKRFGSGPIIENDPNDYADGELHFTVESGQGGLSGGGVPLAKWNYDYSIAAGLNGNVADTLSSFTFKLLFDVDPSADTAFRTLILEPEVPVQSPSGGTHASSNYRWRDQDSGFVFIHDDEGTAKVTQNSQNYGFYSASGLDFDPNTPGIQAYTFGPAEFDIVLEAYEGLQLIARNHMVVDVV